LRLFAWLSFRWQLTSVAALEQTSDFFRCASARRVSL